MKTKLLFLLLLANFSIYAQTNLVPNGGFESWQSNFPTSWSNENSFSRSFEAIQGDNSINLKYITLSPKITNQVPLKGGVTYTVRFRYKYLTNNYNGSHPISLNISKTGSATTLSRSTFATNNLWTERESSFTPDANLSYDLSISTFSFDGEAFDVLIDDVKVYVAGTEQYTLIPDIEFEKALISLGIDSGTVDGKVLTSNVNTVKTITVDGALVSDLTGIQDFTALQSLFCKGSTYSSQTGGNGKLKSLNLSKNLQLITLGCENNQLTSLDLSNNKALSSLSVEGNKLTSLNLKENINLQTIYCFDNQLTSLDLSSNTKLSKLFIRNNKLTSLDLSKNIALTYLTCESNQLSTLNLKNGNNSLLKTNSIYIRDNPKLNCIAVDNVEYAKTTWIYKDTESTFYPFECGSMTVLDTAFEDKLIALKIDTDGKNGAVLNSSIAAITTLDVSNSSLTKLTGIEGFTSLTTLNCSGNSLKRLNVSQNKFLNTLNCSNNSSLKCIQVTDVDAALKWATTKDEAVSFNLNCDTFTLIPDSNFEDKLIALRIDKDGKNGKVNTESIEGVTILDVSSANIKNLSGIEGFTALTSLKCYFNEIENLDLSKNTELNDLSVYGNKLSVLNISKNTKLTQVLAFNNNLTTLEVSANKSLTTLQVDRNKLTTLDVSNNLNLKSLDASSNQLKAISFTKNTALESLKINSNPLKNLDVTQNTSLTTLSCSSNGLTTLDLSNNLALEKLNVGYNSLTNLNLKANTKLTFLDCTSNNLTTFDTSSNTALEYLVAGANGSARVLKTLDLTKNTKLLELEVWQVQIEELNLSQNTALKMLELQSSNISSLDLSKNTALEVALIGGNKLTALDVSNNKLLKTLSCSTNQIPSLDLSKNTALTFLNCGNNNLTSLNLQNGNNSNFVKNVGIYFTNIEGRSGSTYYPNFKGNANLSCIQVDNIEYSNTNWSEIKDPEVNYNALNCGLATTITDLAFEDKLISLGIDTDGRNGAVLNSSINNVTSLDVSNSSIKNLTGLQGFTALQTLNISNNLITKVDLSKNSALKTLNAASNSTLTCIMVANISATENWSVTKDPSASFSLDCEVYTLIPDSNFEDFLIAQKIDRDGKNGKVKTENISQVKYMNELRNRNIKDLTGIEGFTSLIQLDVSNNPLTTLDVSKSQALTYLTADSNSIQDINLSKNVNLTSLSLSSSQLTTLNLSKNVNLTSLSITGNKLKTLDLSQNTKLTRLSVYRGELISLDLSKNTELTEFNAFENQLRVLDLSKNSKLTVIILSGNKLANLNIKNGANTLLTNLDFTANPDLTCIQVDNAAYSNENWKTKKDQTAAFSTDVCPVTVPYTLIPDPKFETKLISLGIDKDGKNGKVATMNIVFLTSLNISNSEITDLTGLQDFSSLTSLDCSNNQLTVFDALKYKSLTSLNISKNKLSASFFRASTSLTNLNISNNEFTNLDLSYFTNLTALSVSFNKLRDLDVSKNIKLREFDCAGNNLYTLNLKNGNNANMQNMTFGNFTENPNLRCIQVDDAAFSTEKWVAKDATASYSAAACPPNFQYTLIPDPRFEKILISQGYDSGEIDGKVLTSKIENITSISAIDLGNRVTDLTGIEDFKSLESLYCYHGAITKIDLSKNLKLKILDIADNQLTTLELSKNTALESLNCGANKLTELNVSNNLALQTLVADNNKLTEINVSKNTALTRLEVGSNQITNIDVTANSALKGLSVYANKITALNTSKNTALTSLSVFSNELTTLDVSQNKALTYLNAKKCQLTAIDISNNVLLNGLEVNENKIGTIDVSKNPLLTSLIVNSNQLTSLNLKNGKNTLLNNNYVSFSSNPKLSCILVDDVTYANTNWPYKKDASATYNTECTGELNLSAYNFTIETKSESCLGENNGEISILGKATYAYTATINDKPYTFTANSLKVNALAPGSYKIKITIPDVIFEQNFTVTIAKGATVAGKSSVTAKTVNVEITEGTAPFTVFVNGTEQFQTNDVAFSVDVNKNALVEVATAKACEGIFAKKVSVSDFESQILSAYPNPTSGSFEIEIPGTKKEVKIELYSFSGQLVSTKTYTIENGKALLNLENHPSGIYAAKIYLETPEYIKIIKK
ncbi:T9SS type A sorting domain-containing protein [Flavobacterium collinsii]|uniref:Probable cell surface protein (Leucine-rich repeat protein) containing a type A C-terminal secretion signal n=1 Tax=Flavobacterium collinsii TaxID=1114861 RepID=A0A9W4TDV0_9FLAO|nr:T9SS type A sorting domain-containing protein [Flavobacterium collinsii]CAI2766187.1 probable cell surface protein (Leucine-rich repeat protein) precursor containing a type A C-terminal secretion signal [Flavobacterium collinsii]